jgi:hypothetical protein
MYVRSKLVAALELAVYDAETAARKRTIPRPPWWYLLLTLLAVGAKVATLIISALADDSAVWHSACAGGDGRRCLLRCARVVSSTSIACHSVIRSLVCARCARTCARYSRVCLQTTGWRSAFPRSRWLRASVALAGTHSQHCVTMCDRHCAGAHYLSTCSSTAT